ncbi:MAG: hypothetical protein QOI33_2911 [Mycobacterium sp.]|jgi:hypothetical protein|nr:hypothetical protein [Mycobacterium sp.]
MRPAAVGTAVGGFSLTRSFSWPDPDVDGTLVISQPSADPELWADYAAGAVRSYNKRGVECVLDLEALRSGEDTIMFGAVVSDSGHVVGGYRAIALRSADESHAVEEWAGQPGQQDVRQMIADRVPYGVLEMKTGWVIDAASRNPLLASALARSCFYMMVMLDFQYTMCTAATPVLNTWRSSGSVVAPVPATPYPNEHYRTKMMWWNRRDFVSHALPGQLTKIVSETRQLLHEQFRRSQVGACVTSLAPPTPAEIVLSRAFEVA